MTEWLTEFAPAKVNLFLHVTGRRPDGYHTLDSLVVFADVGDVLRAEAADTLTLSVQGPFAAGLAGEGDNLVLRAARMLTEATGVRAGARLMLEKNLPVASGIGGGSADAAATLRLLPRLWGVSVDPSVLLGIARSLGADVPVCRASVPARVGGIGEIVAPAPVPSMGLVLVNAGVALSTAEVFAAGPGRSGPAPELPRDLHDASELTTWMHVNTRNDLDVPAERICGAVVKTQVALARSPALLKRMSGSGATCFGICVSATVAAHWAARAELPPGWWCWGGGLHQTW